MGKHERLTNSLTQTEVLLGWAWLIFEVFLLPTLLAMGNAALHNPLGSAWFNFVYFCINFLAAIMIFRKFLGRSVMSLGKNMLRTLKGAFLGFCVYYVSNLALQELIRFLFPWFSNVNDQSVATLLHLNYFPMVIGTVILVPFAEEILFRGLVFQSLYTKNRLLGYVLSTALFCTIHILSYIGTTQPLTLALCFIQYIPAALCLAWAYTESDNIFAPILIHSVINAMAVMAVR